MPNLEKACVMPWGVLKTKPAGHTTANCKKSSFFIYTYYSFLSHKLAFGEKCCAPKITRCSSRNKPSSGCNLKTAIMTQMLRQHNSATAS